LEGKTTASGGDAAALIAAVGIEATTSDAILDPAMAGGPKIAGPAGIDACNPESPVIESAKIEMPKIEASTVEMPRLDIPRIQPAMASAARTQSPKFAPPKLDWIKPLMAEDPALPTAEPTVAAPSAKPAVTAPASEPPVAAPARAHRFALLAASVGVAAALGAMGGALAATGLLRLGPTPSQAAAQPSATIAAEEGRALQSTIAQLRSDLAALKSSVEAGTKNANGQFAKIADRFDRVEKAQAEPAAKLTKAIETLDRIDRRAETVSAGRETTGSVAPQALAAAPSPPIINGWFVRDVYRNIAVLQGPRYGLMEVEAGDVVPGLGRIEAIRKQDGRWVVVTAKGLITSPH
jgi:hypothetical protein